MAFDKTQLKDDLQAGFENASDTKTLEDAAVEISDAIDTYVTDELGASPGGALGVTPGYLCVTLDSDSDGSASAYDPFDEDNHTSFAKTDLVTAVGVTYTQADGKFTIATDFGGVWRITLTYIGTVDVANLINFDILKNGSSVHALSSRIHATTDPTECTIDLILALADADYINVEVESNAAALLVTEAGTTMTIQRVA